MPSLFPTAIPASRGKTAIVLAGAAILSAAALVVHRKSARAETDNPPRGRFLDIDGVRLHYLDQGSGEPIVLLHGNGSMIEDYLLAGVVESLARTHRVIAFDRPGFGHTPRPSDRIWNADLQADLIHAALRELDIASPVVVGHSWGTMVATALALAHPESVKRLVLIAGYYFPTPRVDVPLMSIPAVPGIGFVMRHTLSPLISRMMWPMIRRKLFGPAKVSPSFNRWPVWMTLRPSQLQASAADTAMMVPQAMKMQHHYGDLRMPVTIIAGDGDKIVNTRVQSQQLHEAVAGSSLRVVEGAGHMVHHIAPEAVIAAIEGDDETPATPAIPALLMAPAMAPSATAAAV